MVLYLFGRERAIEQEHFLPMPHFPNLCNGGSWAEAEVGSQEVNLGLLYGGRKPTT